jgi:hypothetical protein
MFISQRLLRSRDFEHTIINHVGTSNHSSVLNSYTAILQGLNELICCRGAGPSKQVKYDNKPQSLPTEVPCKETDVAKDIRERFSSALSNRDGICRTSPSTSQLQIDLAIQRVKVQFTSVCIPKWLFNKSLTKYSYFITCCCCCRSSWTWKGD